MNGILIRSSRFVLFLLFFVAVVVVVPCKIGTFFFLLLPSSSLAAFVFRLTGAGYQRGRTDDRRRQRKVVDLSIRTQVEIVSLGFLFQRGKKAKKMHPVQPRRLEKPPNRQRVRQESTRSKKNSVKLGKRDPEPSTGLSTGRLGLLPSFTGFCWGRRRNGSRLGGANNSVNSRATAFTGRPSGVPSFFLPGFAAGDGRNPPPMAGSLSGAEVVTYGWKRHDNNGEESC